MIRGQPNGTSSSASNNIGLCNGCLMALSIPWKNLLFQANISLVNFQMLINPSHFQQIGLTPETEEKTWQVADVKHPVYLTGD